MQVEALLHARWVIPVEPPGCVLEKHSVAIDQGRIVAVLPTTEARDTFAAQQEVVLSEHALLPGLINAHTHAAMSLLRGLADDLALQEWLHGHIWPAERHHVSREFVRDGTRLAIVEMLRCGTTCFNDMYFFPEETAATALTMGMRVVMGIIVIDAPSAFAKHWDEYLCKGIAARDRFAAHPLFHATLAPHAPYSVADSALREVARLADELDIPVHMHVHETKAEVRENAIRPLRRLCELGLVNERLLAVHAIWLDDAELALLADRGCHVVHCPESNLKLASGICRVQDLLNVGVNVCLGTDGAASNNDLDMFGELRTASLLCKVHNMDATALSAQSSLTMATLGAARALGLAEELGSLQEGKWADLIAVDLGAPETQPTYDPISQIVYAAGREQVSDVWVAGVQRLRKAKVLDLDWPCLRERVARWHSRITACPAGPDGEEKTPPVTKQSGSGLASG